MKTMLTFAATLEELDKEDATRPDLRDFYSFRQALLRRSASGDRERRVFELEYRELMDQDIILNSQIIEKTLFAPLD